MHRAVMISLVIVAVLTGCGSGSDDEAEDNNATQAPTTASPDTSETATSGPDRSERAGTVVTTDPSNYGTMLFDESGQAIYLFDRETSQRPRCYRGCAEAWPPVFTKGEPQADGRVESSLLGTTRRKDGSLQVTYAGHPLYFYAHEGEHEVLCHNVDEFGGLWLVVQPDGDAAA